MNASTHFTERKIQLLWCWINRANNNEIRNEQSAEDVIEMNVRPLIHSLARSTPFRVLSFNQRCCYWCCCCWFRDTLAKSKASLFPFASRIPTPSQHIKYVCLEKWCHSNCVQSFESNQIQLNIELKWDEMELNVTTVLFKYIHTHTIRATRTPTNQPVHACESKQYTRACTMASMMKFIWETRGDPN